MALASSPTAFSALARAIADARDPRAASEAIVEALLARGLKPSVYLERGGRLRCEAARTYPQVFDGIPPSAGVIGQTFSSGRETLLTDIQSSAEYIQITEGIRAQICVPLHLDGRCVGVINAESRRAVTPDDVQALRDAAALLEQHLVALGGVPRETAAQRLIRHVSRLSDTQSVAAITPEVLAAAVDISELDSAAIVGLDGSGAPQVGAAIGPLAELLRATPATDLEDACTYVHAGCSCVTTDHGEHGPELLRNARAEGLGVAVLLTLTTDPFRMLICAGGHGSGVATETVELLELLCAQARSIWRTCELMSDLRHQATTDPLTGLLHHGCFHARLATDGTGAVVMIDLDHFKAHNDAHGHAAGDALLQSVAATLRTVVGVRGEVFRVGGDEFAIMLPDSYEARDGSLPKLIERIEAALAGSVGASVSMGLALAREGETADATSRRADAALYRAKLAGRGRFEISA